MTTATETQVNVGTVIADAMDAALKQIFKNLAAGKAGDIPVNEHPVFSALSATQADSLATLVASGELQDFLTMYSGISYKMGFLPALPALTVTQQKDVERISVVSAAKPHILGGGISITGTWTF